MSGHELKRNGLTDPECNRILDTLQPGDETTIRKALARLRELLREYHARAVTTDTGVGVIDAIWNNISTSVNYLARVAGCTGLNARQTIRNPRDAIRCLQEIRMHQACGEMAKELNQLFQEEIYRNHWNHWLESREKSLGPIHGWVVVLYRCRADDPLRGDQIDEGVIKFDPWTGNIGVVWSSY